MGADEGVQVSTGYINTPASYNVNERNVAVQSERTAWSS